MPFDENEELVSIENIFENNDYVLMQATYVPKPQKIIRTSVGIKDEKGDIIEIIDVDEKHF